MKRFFLYLTTLVLELIFGLQRVFMIAIPLFFVIVIVSFFNNYDYYFGSFAYQRFGNYGWASFVDDWVIPPLFFSLGVGLMLGYLNIFFSLQAFIAGGQFITRFVLGARSPSSRERHKIYDTLNAVFRHVKGPVKGFSTVFIIDSPFDQVNLIGTTLYISSGAVQSNDLPVLLAHEIGHLNNGDGRMVLALRRLVFIPFQLFLAGVRGFSTNRPNPKPELKEFEAMEVFFFLANKLLFFWCARLGGGIGVWLLSWQWAKHFREADYKADAFVASLGLRDQLIEHLEQFKFYDAAVPYMLGWRPANELRIDRLLNSKGETLAAASAD